MSAPRATLRLQFHGGFTFDDAIQHVPYLSELGVSHVYASPIMTARRGSNHGYDVTDPTRVNPELGGEDALRRLAAALRNEKLGLIVDIVPNNMAVGPENPWWMDVLEHGRDSPYAGFFDIDWDVDDPTLNGKVLAPFLGRPYGEALAAGELTLARQGEQFVLRYFDNAYPIAPRDRAALEGLDLDAFDPKTADGRKRLHALLERQHYRLAWWRTAGDEINWRRFFDVNELAALRADRDDVFETTHATLFRLYREGLVDGVRVDHVDGLANPKEYCMRLRARLDGLTFARPAEAPTSRPYIVVEKILGRGEELDPSWRTDGTSGYDFMDQVAAALHDPDGEESLTRLWQRTSGRPGLFETEEVRARREILDRSFSAQFEAAVATLHDLARADLATRDTARPAIRRALTNLLSHMPVYRTYALPAGRSEQDAAMFSTALKGAKATALRADRSTLERMDSFLGGAPAPPELADLQRLAIRRFEQLSAPVAAKAVEDTAFYRYGRLLSRNEVGSDVSRFADAPEAFHANMQRRRRTFPHALLATATHDHKRGEDARARLAVLSEIPDEWQKTLNSFVERSGARCAVDDEPAPSPGDVVMMVQTIVGSWPLDLSLGDADGLSAYAERLVQWQRKALREAKLATDWTAPNEAYESAARDLLMRVMIGADGKRLRAELYALVERIAPAGAINALTQMLMKLTAPGVPDIYQGTEFWDFSMVDPDNRRPVDFEARRFRHGQKLSHCLGRWRDGRLKQFFLTRALNVRRDRAHLFADGDYRPLTVVGPKSDHFLAFARVGDGDGAITIAPRLIAKFTRSGHLDIPPETWGATRVLLPAEAAGKSLRDAITGEAMASVQGALRIADLGPLPIALAVWQ